MNVANPERGEGLLRAGAQAYVLRPTLGALCAVEAETGVKYADLVSRVPTLDLSALVTLLWAFLQPYYAATIQTLDDAGPIVDRAGVSRTIRAIHRTLTANKSARADPDQEGNANPWRAQVGTGPQWRWRLVGSA